MVVSATVGGEFPRHDSSGKPGMRPETKTRKPGDLPSDGITYSRDWDFGNDDFDDTFIVSTGALFNF